MTIYNLKLAYRRFNAHIGDSFVKIFSLFIGIISLFFIILYAATEFSYDDFHTQKDSIYAVQTTIGTASGDIDLALSAPPLGEFLVSEYPEVVEYARILQSYESRTLQHDDQLFSESENLIYADPSFFHVFDFELLSGNPETVLDGPSKLVLTESMALKYFGTTEITDNSLYLDGELYTVTGIAKDIPVNSHIQFDFLVSLDSFLASRPNASQNWEWFPLHTYFLLDDPGHASALASRLNDIPAYQETNTGDKYTLNLQSFDNIHFSQARLGDLSPKSDARSLYLLLVIGGLILVLAVSNYINLNIAELTIQGKDVSVKKTLGASGKDIFQQYFTGALLICTSASFFAILFSMSILPWIESMIGYQLIAGNILNIQSILLTIVFILMLSLLSGLYPSLRFAGISPTALFNKMKTVRRRKLDTRTALVVFQFTVTSVLIIGSFIIYSQLNFLKNSDLGVDLDRKLVIEYGSEEDVNNSFSSLKTELKSIAGVNNVTFSSHVPGEVPNGVSTLITGEEGMARSIEINLNLIDPDFIENYDLDIIAGRGFSEERLSSDLESALILNESTVKAYGFTNPEEIIGATFEQWGGNGTVIGVVSDFNYLSLHQEIGLLSLKIWPEQFRKVTLDISGENTSNTIEQVQQVWNQRYPGVAFTYYFADEHFRDQYERDQNFASIIGLFTVVSFSIGILGLVAFANFWSRRKRKEISIRKVLGAETVGLIWNMYKNFSIPVVISFILAAPIAWIAGKNWISQFAYQVPMQWYLFVLPLLALLFGVWLAVGYQTTRTVLSNPVESLKEE